MNKFDFICFLGIAIFVLLLEFNLMKQKKKALLRLHNNIILLDNLFNLKINLFSFLQFQWLMFAN